MTRLVLVCLIWLPTLTEAQSLASSYWRPLAGKTCKSEKDFSQLNGFRFTSGNAISDPLDTEQKLVHQFTKGDTVVIFFIVRQEDSRLYILDAVEIRNFTAEQEIIIGECRYGNTTMPGLVALVKKTSGTWKAQKAWNFDTRKLTVQTLVPARVNCLSDQGAN